MVTLVFWLTIIFIGWGIFAPRNATVGATWFVSRLLKKLENKEFFPLL